MYLCSRRIVTSAIHYLDCVRVGTRYPKSTARLFCRPPSPLSITVSRYNRLFSSTNAASMGFYDLKADLPGGKTYDFEQLKGKVVLVVNTASQWCVPHG